MISILYFILFASLANAASMAPDFQIATSSQNGVVTLTAKARPGFHFNLDAPHFLEVGSQKIKASRESESELSYAVPNPRALRLSAYLCDDQKTFCEKHVVQATWDGKTLAVATQSTDSTGEKTPQTATSTLDEHGFYVNQPELAFSQAQAKKLPVLIDFYGIWCPPCNELNENVFGASAFKEQAKNFVLLKMDVDSELSWKLKDQYKIQGYPTLVFASANGDEISRVVGYREAKLLSQSMKEAFQLKDEPFSKLKEKADHGDLSASDNVGQIYLDRAEYKEAVIYLTHTRKLQEKLIDAQLGMLSKNEGSASKKLLVSMAEDAVTRYPHSPSTIDWYGTLSQNLDGAKKDEALRKLVALSRELLKKLPTLKGYDLTREDLLEEIAESLDTLKDPAAKKAWKEAAVAYQAKIHASDERGYNLENAYCLWKGGDESGAREVYEKLRKRYPSEFTFHYAEARMEFQLAHADLAEPLAKTAYENSYGDNKLRATLLFAQILKKEGKTKEAKETVSKTLASLKNVESAPDSVRTNRHVKALQDFEKDYAKD
jgi:thioredoxin-like negative regulator of GroEL